MNLARINAWSESEARAEFCRCCGSQRWAEAMTALRPFSSEAAIFAAAERAWWKLDRADWLEAFAAHPRIGDVDTLRVRFAAGATAAWSAAEQAGVSEATEEMLRRLAEGNRAYEERFGYIFIVCATGKSAAEMLERLEARLGNAPDDEIAVAAAEQAKITRLRLERIAC
jgi:2-oxo-4-hydroxy-4-carboxy-5-ureidoimidazoline decarboxylase